ncbi:MAG: DUF401 family protein [Halanaerobium sp.]|nr:DUF401 family protein [Halanaerobium sp.]
MKIFGLILAFIIAIILVVKKLPIGLSLLSGSLVIALTSAMGWQQMVNVFWRGLTNSDTVELAAVIALISIMSYLMNKTGMIDGLLNAIQVIFKDPRASLIIIPSLLGGLPIPGGAMLSAPLVRTVGSKIGFSKEREMAVNLIYRHIWYFIFPFEPTLILAAKLAGIDLLAFILWQLPLTIVIGLISYYYYFRQFGLPVVGNGKNGEGGEERKDGSDNLVDRDLERDGVTARGLSMAEAKEERSPLLQLLVNGMPLILAIGVAFLFQMNFLLGLVIGIGFIAVYKYRSIHLLMFIKGVDLPLFSTILGIMVFKEFINYGHALQELADIFVGLGIHPYLLAVILPGLVSFFTGSRPAAIGITFPLLAQILPTIGITEAIIIFGSGFFTYLVSPIHICFALTQSFFAVDYKSVYRELAVPVACGVGTLLLLAIIT